MLNRPFVPFNEYHSKTGGLVPEHGVFCGRVSALAAGIHQRQDGRGYFRGGKEAWAFANFLFAAWALSQDTNWR
ncbi:MAG: hypothetical protein ACI8PT_000170 [Gammaproteobacteria bacterium]|jgi:hypothetical protein